jgi:sodium/hydrogen antiporter
VFAAGMGLRGAELQVVHESPHPSTLPDNGDVTSREDSDAAGVRPSLESHPPAEDLVPKVTANALGQPSVAAGTLLAEVLSFGDTIERLLEVLLVLIVGIALAQHWDTRAFALALVLMMVVRPLGTHLVLLGTPTTPAQRLLISWFGIRGIGSLYYLAYALGEGLPAALGAELSAFTLSVVAISVFVHGVTSQPMLARYERALARRKA